MDGKVTTTKEPHVVAWEEYLSKHDALEKVCRRFVKRGKGGSGECPWWRVLEAAAQVDEARKKYDKLAPEDDLPF